MFTLNMLLMQDLRSTKVDFFFEKTSDIIITDLLSYFGMHTCVITTIYILFSEAGKSNI